MKLDGKRILVTGADGFIGSHLVERLVARGLSVRAFCLYNSFNSWRCEQLKLRAGQNVSHLGLITQR